MLEGSYKWETRRRDGGHEFVGSVNGIIKEIMPVEGHWRSFSLRDTAFTRLTRESYVWHILIMNHGNLELEQ